MCLKEFVGQASNRELSPLLESRGVRTEVTLDHSMWLVGVKAGWWLVRRESLKFLPGKSPPLHGYREATHFTYWPPAPCPCSTEEATRQLQNPNSKASSRKHSTAHWVFEAGCEFSLWLTAVCCTKAEEGQMAVTVAKLSLGCGPTRPMISWESMGDGSQPGQKDWSSSTLGLWGLATSCELGLFNMSPLGGLIWSGELSWAVSFSVKGSFTQQHSVTQQTNPQELSAFKSALWHRQLLLLRSNLPSWLLDSLVPLQQVCGHS